MALDAHDGRREYGEGLAPPSQFILHRFAEDDPMTLVARSQREDRRLGESLRHGSVVQEAGKG
ncbi:MAG: hypothetical protein AAF264_02190 [Pseudomonadota bacterium]